jgi:hypothetical protein
MANKDPKLDRLRGKIRRARREEKRHTKKASLYKRKVAFLRLAITKTVNRRRDLTKVAVLDGTPITREQKIAFLYARTKGWNGVVNSGDRRVKIARLLARLGKSTQQALWDLFQAGRGAPANPPWEGTHQRLGDRTIGTPGEPIPAWQQGVDTSYATQLRSILNAAGFNFIQTYGNEEWHSNSMSPIKPTLIKLGLV